MARTAMIATTGSQEGGLPLTYTAAEDRYQQIPYRRCGRSGLLLPEVLANNYESS
jgi:hypothetical protein